MKRQETKKYTALVIGATGLVGSHLLSMLLADQDFAMVRIFVRRTTGIRDPRLEEHLVDFDNLDAWKNELIGDVLFSALGTTLKQAGSKPNQYRVDYTYQYQVAQAASRNQVNNYLLVSSIGADPGSKLFYPRIKGELDQAVQALNFDSTCILRPAGLMGKRENERKAESRMIGLTSWLCRIFPFLRKYQPIHAATVASAMINLSKKGAKTGWQVIDNRDIFSLANTSGQ